MFKEDLVLLPPSPCHHWNNLIEVVQWYLAVNGLEDWYPPRRFLPTLALTLFSLIELIGDGGTKKPVLHVEASEPGVTLNDGVLFWEGSRFSVAMYSSACRLLLVFAVVPVDDVDSPVVVFSLFVNDEKILGHEDALKYSDGSGFSPGNNKMAEINQIN